jgi:peptidoglycan/xylan/chitin deacetylase (PgdA/CDA1 family)
MSSLFENKDSSINESNKPLLALTMDDCFKTDFLSANKICQENEVNCTYFVPVYYMESKKTLWSYRLNHFLSNKKTPCRIIDFDNNEVILKGELDIKIFEEKWINFFLYNEIQTLEIDIVIDKFLSVNSFIENLDSVIAEDVIRLNRNNKYASFQSHTVTHPKLFLCSEQELEYEFGRSKEVISKLDVNEKQNVICYPYGSNIHIGNSYVKASNYYEYGVTLQSGVVTSQSNKMLIPRIGIYEHDTYQSIRVKIFFAQVRNLFK